MEAEQPQSQQPQQRFLSEAERNDLRKKVLRGERLSLEEARAVIETCRLGGAAAIAAGADKPKKGKKKEALSDAALDADLADLGL